MDRFQTTRPRFVDHPDPDSGRRFQATTSTREIRSSPSPETVDIVRRPGVVRGDLRAGLVHPRRPPGHRDLDGRTSSGTVRSSPTAASAVATGWWTPARSATWATPTAGTSARSCASSRSAATASSVTTRSATTATSPTAMAASTPACSARAATGSGSTTRSLRRRQRRGRRRVHQRLRARPDLGRLRRLRPRRRGRRGGRHRLHPRGHQRLPRGSCGVSVPTSAGTSRLHVDGAGRRLLHLRHRGLRPTTRSST